MTIRIKHIYLMALLSILILGCSSDDDATNPTTEAGLSSRTVISNLSIPWELQWGPDDFLWVTERNGRISRINPESGEQFIIADLGSIIEQIGESGLLGFALHPEFNTNPFVYLVYTYRNGSGFYERLVRYAYLNSTLVNETVLLDNIPAGNRHNGSRILITPDHHILMTTGDAGTPRYSQDSNSLAGKILRLNLDGSIPVDNPDPNSYVYTLGHRNPQGLAIHSNGLIYSAEHGPSTDDEINIIEAQGNYGWPNVLGVVDTPDEEAFAQQTTTIESITHWTPTIAPSDLMLYTSNRIPQWSNKLLLTSLREQTLFAITLSSDGRQVIERERYFDQQFGRIRDAVMAPDGRLFIATNGTSFTDTSATHRIIEIDVQN